MEIIINLWQELLQDIQITTKQGRKLRMHIDKDQSGCVLAGEFFEITDKAWYLVEFSKKRVADPELLLRGCLENLQKAMDKKSDSITEMHNTCNAPIVSAERQRELLSELGIQASVRVN